jgi:endonuclease/exonuclease/phosphatase family metal-dependent hydrolase
MTWNLLTETADAPCWRTRIPAAAAYVQELAPAVLGTQEGSRVMLDDLVARLPGYRWVGEGRRGRGREEHSAVVYDGRVLTLLDLRNRWLSSTPEVPGSVAPDADLPRMLTAARFHDSESGVVFTVVNTHLDHLGPQARLDGAALVAGAGGRGRTVVLGDFNAVTGSEPYQVLTRSGLVDALEPRDRAARRLRTFTGLDQPEPDEGEQIDWVLVTPDITVTDGWVAEPPGPPYPSDHRPVVADVVVT